MAARGVTFPEADATNCGGVTAFIKITHLAEAFNLPITSHGAHDLTVQLLAALPNRFYLEVHGFGLERFLTQPFDLRDGFATAPERPGHGVEFDRRRSERAPDSGSCGQTPGGASIRERAAGSPAMTSTPAG